MKGHRFFGVDKGVLGVYRLSLSCPGTSLEWFVRCASVRRFIFCSSQQAADGSNSDYFQKRQSDGAFLLAWINRGDTTTRSARRVANRQHIHTHVCFHAVLPVGHGAAVFKAGDESLRRGDGGVRRQAAVGGRPRQRRKVLETTVKYVVGRS